MCTYLIFAFITFSIFYLKDVVSLSLEGKNSFKVANECVRADDIIIRVFLSLCWPFFIAYFVATCIIGIILSPFAIIDFLSEEKEEVICECGKVAKILNTGVPYCGTCNAFKIEEKWIKEEDTI